MKTISIAEFEDLVSRDDWQREQDYEIGHTVTEREILERDEEGNPLETVDVSRVYGWATKTSTLDGIKIIHNRMFNYYECEPDTLNTTTEGQDADWIWQLEGASVVDEEGEVLSAAMLADYGMLPPDFSSIDYSMLKIAEVTDVDVDEDSDMETFTIDIDNAPSIRFTGELLASAASSGEWAGTSNYSGSRGRWTELELYKTAGGKFICRQIGRTSWQNERERYSGKVCETVEEVKAFFGHRWLAKTLYGKAGIEDVMDVD